MLNQNSGSNFNSTLTQPEQIVVMPEQFYGLKPQYGGIHKAEEQKTPVVATKFRKSGGLKMILMIVGIILVLVFSGYLLYMSFFQPAAPIVEQSVVKPEPTPEPESEPEIEPEPEPEFESELESIKELQPESELEIELATKSVTVEVIEPLVVKSLDNLTSLDTDKDGLTDAEELLLGTDMNNPDSDGDIYLDGQEVISLYNPLGTDPEKIEFSGIVSTYVNTTFNYEIFYPVKWIAKSVDKADVEIMFSSTQTEFVNLIVEENKDNLSVRDWYKKIAPDVADSDLIDFTNKHGVSGLRSPDGFTVYFAKDNLIYIISYNIGLKDSADYPNLYKMMVESFIFTNN